MKNSLAVFENYKIRRIYDENTEKWYFSIIDIILVLTQQDDYQAARNYWKVLKNRLNKQGSESVTKCNQLKMEASDGKKYLTDVADAETDNSTGLEENKKASKIGGGIAKKARLELEQKTGKKVVTEENYLPPSTIKKIKRNTSNKKKKK